MQDVGHKRGASLGLVCRFHGIGPLYIVFALLLRLIQRTYIVQSVDIALPCRLSGFAKCALRRTKALEDLSGALSAALLVFEYALRLLLRGRISL